MTRILVIEDEPAILNNILETLEMEGFETEGVAEGHIGLRVARDFQPDLIVCDVMLPELDGFSILLELRHDPATAAIPFIFVTAKADRQSMRKGMELGADDYLTKPFTPPELLAAVMSRLERTTGALRAQRQQIDEARRKLVQMVTHELRTPLISISMVPELISRQLGQLTPEQMQDLLADLGTGSQRLKRLVEQMVLITRLEAGALTGERIRSHGLPTQSWELLTAAIDLARKSAYRQPDVTVRLDDRNTDAMVQSDRGALKQALAEVLINAISFSSAGSEVVVSQWRADECVWISVVDHGPGIPAEQLEQVFEDFYQFERESSDQQGIGLGLPLARRIFEAHGGSLTLDSVVGKGTQVVICLPELPSTRLEG